MIFTDLKEEMGEADQEKIERRFNQILGESHKSNVKVESLIFRYLSLPPTRQDLTQGQWPEGRLKWGLCEGNVGHEPKHET